MATTHHEHQTPTERLLGLMKIERDDLYVLGVYTVIAGLLALIVPLTAQALVNIIASNVLVQPLVVLTVLTFVALLLVAFLQIAKVTIVEKIQQRVFARTSLQMAQHLISVRESALRGEYAPELVNRFFDVLTVQKALSKLLFDGFAALLQALVGLVLLATYNPLLFGFDLMVLLMLAFIVGVLGLGGLRTSIQESREKYHVADWLEEIARCHAGFKLHGAKEYLVSRADNLVVRYLVARSGHMRVLIRQSFGYYLFQAVASAGIIAVGGYLVINRQLTLGQLVAAQIIVVSLLASLEKLVRQHEHVYDLLTGLDKIGHVLDLETERKGGNALIGAPRENGVGQNGASVHIRDLRFSYAPGSEILSGLNLEIAPGERVGLVGSSGAGKTTLTSLLCGLEEPSHGVVAIDGADVREWDLTNLRRHVSRVGNDMEIFDGTITENIAVGRDYVTPERVSRAMEQSQFTHDLARMPQGTQTMLVSGGQNLSRGQAQRVLISRAIAGEPRLLILDEAFNAVDEKTANAIRDDLFAPQNPWTIFAVTHNAETVVRCSRVVVLDEGRIVEEGEPMELARRQDSALCRLFPSLGDSLRGRAGRDTGFARRENTRRRPLSVVGSRSLTEGGVR